jgi:hypothetical protein
MSDFRALIFGALQATLCAAAIANDNDFDIAPAPAYERGKIVPAAQGGVRYTDPDGWFVVSVPAGSKARISPYKEGKPTSFDVIYPRGPQGQFRNCIFWKERIPGKPPTFTQLQARTAQGFTPEFDRVLFGKNVPANMTRKMIKLNEFGAGMKVPLQMNFRSYTSQDSKPGAPAVTIIGTIETPKGEVSVGCTMVHEAQGEAILTNALQIADGAR